MQNNYVIIPEANNEPVQFPSKNWANENLKQLHIDFD